MTVEEARRAYGLNQNWVAHEPVASRIIFSNYDTDVIVREDGSAFELRWVIRSYGHDVQKTELERRAT